MKIAQLVQRQKIEIKDVDISVPTGHEVLISVVSCGICGSDIPRYFENAIHYYPIVLGHEFYAKVISVGEKVTKFAPGDDVVGVPLVPCMECDDCKAGDYSLCKHYSFIGSRLNGAFCERMIVNDKNLYKISSEIASKYCALFEPSTVAVHAVKLYSDYKDKKIAVVGGGTIGELLYLWAKAYGAENVVLFVRRHDNDETYRRIGIDNIELSSDDNVAQAKGKYTAGKGFDIVFDATGNNKTIISSLMLACNHANVCLVGTPTGAVSFEKQQWELINRKELFVTGTWMSYSAPFPGKEWEETELALKEGKLKFDENFFAGQFELDKINDAFDFISKGKNGSVGRVLIVNR